MKTAAKKVEKKTVCPKCGLPEFRWSHPGRGVLIKGEYYCCEGCPENTGCSCALEDPRFITEEF